MNGYEALPSVQTSVTVFLALFNLLTLYLLVTRPRLGLFARRRESRDHGRFEYSFAIQNFEERDIQGDIRVEFEAERPGAFRDAVIRTYAGPAAEQMQPQLSDENIDVMVITAKRLRALKTWSFEVQTEAKRLTMRFLVPARGWSERFVDFLAPFVGRQIVRRKQARYVAISKDVHARTATTRARPRMTLDIAVLLYCIFFSVTAFAALRLLLVGSLTSVRVVDALALLAAVGATVVAYFLLRRPLFPVAQGYRVPQVLDVPCKPSPEQAEAKPEQTKPPRIEAPPAPPHLPTRGESSS